MNSLVFIFGNPEEFSIKGLANLAIDMINPKLRWSYKPFPKEYSLKKS